MEQNVIGSTRTACLCFTPPSGRGLVIPGFFLVVTCPRPPVFRSAKQILVMSFATQVRARILSDRNINILGATTNASWIYSPNIPIIKTSRSSTCVKACFPWANIPKAFPAMSITTWPSRTRGINLGYAMSSSFNHFPPRGKTV